MVGQREISGAAARALREALSLAKMIKSTYDRNTVLPENVCAMYADALTNLWENLASVAETKAV